MRASELSFEILSLIASLLTNKDKLCCTLVCNAWKAPFQDALWSRIEISGYEKLDSLFNVLLEANIYLANGHRVRELLFNKGVATSEEQLLTTQKYFRNISYLKIRLGNLSYSHPAVVPADWSLWGKLTRLEIYVSGLNSENEAQDILHVISSLPVLERFDLTDNYYTRRKPYTFQDFESFHRYSPRLKYLAMDLLTTTISIEDILQADIVPTTVLTTVNLFNRTMDLGWLYYCALKYPNVHTFGWKMDCRQDPAQVQDQDQDQIMSRFAALECFFPHLDTLFVRDILKIDLRHTIFWKLLCQFGVFPRNLYYDLEWIDSTPYQSRRTLGNGMYSCPNHLKTLSLTSFNHNFLLTYSLLTLGEFPQLVDLHIMLNRASIFFDVLLDQCLSLKTLRLDNCLILFDSTSRNCVKHGLRRLQLSHLKVDPRTFDYISLHCQELSHLYLSEVRVIGSMSKDTGALYLNMSYTRLKLLKLENVHFYSSKTEYDKDLIKLLCIKQSEISTISGLDNPGSVERRLISVLEGLWLHYYQSRSEGKLGAKIRILHADEIEYAKRYFVSFRNKMTVLADSYMTWNELGPVQSSWKDDLCQGHVEISCRYLEELSIDNVLFSKAII
ncbi:hypothetical protein CLU79DRAFT_757338 [Phycomyces nitens]|nr:hypothetical protein CLU79DRAFT_757338 [Phycomyces nitens]